MNQNPEATDCPWCGKAPTVRERSTTPKVEIGCENVCPVHPRIYASTVEDALTRWNTRAPAGDPRDSERLLVFAGRCIQVSREHGPGDLEGGEVQEWLLDAGLLEKRQVTEPCGEECLCAEWDSFPQDCYFASALGQRAIDAALCSPEPGEGDDPVTPDELRARPSARYTGRHPHRRPYPHGHGSDVLEVWARYPGNQ